MKRKVMWNIASIVLFSILVVSALILVVLYQTFDSQARLELMEESEYIATALNQANDPMDYLEAVRDDGQNTRITLVREDGAVLYDNSATATLENHIGRPEIQDALHFGFGESTRSSETLSTRTRYYAVRLDDGSVIRLANTQKSVLGLTLHLLPTIAIIIVAVFIITTLIANKLTNSIVNPINRLDLDQPRANNVYEELSPLLSSLAHKNEQIEEQFRMLREQQDNFITITGNMREGLVLLNQEGLILTINESAADFFQADGNSLLHQPVLMLSRNLVLQQVVDVAKTGSPEEQVMQQDGKYYQLLANPVMEEGSVSGIVLLILDITDRAEAEEMRKSFSANVSHELKTPLTSISGYAEIIKNGLAQPEDITQFAERIYQESNRLICLIQDIIKLSQLDEGGGAITRQEVSLVDLVEDTVAQLNQSAAEKDVTITLSADHTPYKMQGNPSLLGEMVYNLLDNAIKYNNEQGTVSISLTENEASIQLTVKDSGIGIPADQQDKVFQRFYRVDKSHSKETGGTGLGLSIVKNGAQFHNATVALESEAHEGTTVRITFPKQTR